MITNDDLEPDQASLITMEFDLTSFKCFVSIINPFALDLRGSKFGALIGSEPTVIRQTQYGTDIPNITNSLDTLYIHCDLVDNDVIYTISTADLRRSYPFKDEPILKGFCEVNKTIINSIRIYIADALGKIINLNKVNTFFIFILKDNKNITYNIMWGARWLSGRVSDSGARGRGFETYRGRVVSLSKTLYSPKVLVNYPGSGGSVPT